MAPPFSAGALAASPAAALASAALLAFAGAVLYLLYHLVFIPLSLMAHYKRQGLRGTPWRPIIGDMWTIARFLNKPDGFYAISQWSQAEFGMLNWGFLGPEMRVRVFRPDLVREVLVAKNASFQKPWLAKRVLGPLLGDKSLLLSEGAVHRRHRSMINPAFHFINLKGMTGLMADAATRAVDAWVPTVSAQTGGAGQQQNGASQSSSPAVFDLHVAISALTLDIIGRAAFGSSVGGASSTSEEVYTSLAALLSAAVNTVLSLRAFIPGYEHLPTPYNLQIQRNINNLRRVLDKAVAGRRAAREAAQHAAATAAASTSSTDASGAGPDPLRYGDILVDLLLDAREGDASGGAKTASAAAAGKRFTDTEVRDEAMTFLAAGHETTSQALCWTMMLMAQHPEWKEKARQQVLSVVGRDRAPQYDDLAHLPLLTAILNESFRLYPPVPLITRVAAEDVTLEGADDGSAAHYAADQTGPKDLHVKAGTTVIIPIAALHRDPMQWPDPSRFDPTRFEGGGSAVAGGGAGVNAKAHPMSFIPFSAGPRNCVGSNFALLEARLILAVLLQKVDWELDAATYKHHPVGMITLRPKYGMPVRMWRL